MLANQTHTRLTVVAMIRNEADILPAFLAHLRIMFDRVLVIDHMSTDGSREILEAAREAGQAIEIYRYDVQGYFQAALSNAFARKAFADGADWVFFLDADEFVDVPDRAALLGLLIGKSPACKFRWRNLAPTRFGEFECFDLDQDFLFAPCPSRYGKVAISRAILDQAPRFFLELGNHAVCAEPRGLQLAVPEVGEFLHLPIRSLARLQMKVQAGAAAYRAKSRDRTIDGFHWFELLERGRAGTLDEAFLRRVALSYGEKLDSLKEGLADALACHVLPAGVSPGLASPLAKNQKETITGESAVPWTILRAEGDENVLVHIENGNRATLATRVFRADGTTGPDRFAVLPPAPEPLADDVSMQRIASALDLASRPIETLTPSAWSRLVPAMFALVALLRPRRFVELGSHYGLSFFAANQAMSTLDLASESVAIDTWRGDPQAGFYDDQVFADFAFLLRTRHPDRAYYIRARFEDAVACFDDGSIDLLHIDGLHTYDAVRADFETWLPKMSDRGVIMMHDTTVYEADFGVWQFWREVATRYPAINLLHGHGLGIVYVGKPCRFGDTLSSLASDPESYIAFNALFRGLGDLALAAAEQKQQPANAAAELAVTREALAEAQTALAQAQTALAEAQTGRAQAQAEVVAVRNSTSWKISAPVRKVARIIRGA